MIALSRLADYRHDVWDVTAGGTLGMSVAWFSYRRYYPALQSIRCDATYEKEDADADSLGKRDDEELGLSRPFISRDGSVNDEHFQLEETNSRGH